MVGVVAVMVVAFRVARWGSLQHVYYSSVYGGYMEITQATPEAISALLDAHAITVGVERELHAALAALFTHTTWGARSEVTLGPGERIDFLVDDVGVELKTQGAPAAVFGQLQRYARHDVVQQLLLVTTRAEHATIPAFVGGKPCRVHVLRRAWLT